MAILKKIAKRKFSLNKQVETIKRFKPGFQIIVPVVEIEKFLSR